MQIKGDNEEEQMSKESIQYSQIDSDIFKYRLQKEIEYAMRKWKNNKIQYQNAQQLLSRCVSHSQCLMDIFYRLIEQQIFAFKNFDLLKYIVCNVKNEQLIYEDKLLIAQQNLEALLLKISESDISMINRMLKSDHDLIVRAKMNQLPQLSETESQTKHVIDQQFESISSKMSSFSSDQSMDSSNLSSEDDSHIDSSGNQHHNNKAQQDLSSIKRQKQEQRNMQIELFENLKQRDQYEKDINCNMVYTEQFLDDFSRLNAQLQINNEQQEQINSLQQQIDMQITLINNIKNKLAYK